MDPSDDVEDVRLFTAHRLREALAPALAARLGEVRTHDAEDEDGAEKKLQHFRRLLFESLLLFQVLVVVPGVVASVVVVAASVVAVPGVVDDFVEFELMLLFVKRAGF